MNILPFERQVACIAALTEGVSIRATERLTDTHRDTIMRLGVRVGEGCAQLHDRMMRGVWRLIQTDAPSESTDEASNSSGLAGSPGEPLQVTPGRFKSD